MRDVFLVILFLIIVLRTFGAPHIGVLGWTWLTLMTPHKLAFGFSYNIPFNLILGIVTFAAWILSSTERKHIPVNTITVSIILFATLVTITTFSALNPNTAWIRWDYTIKVITLGIFVASIMNTRVRIHALIWIIVLSIGFFGIKGGLFTLSTGGVHTVLAAGNSALTDNNHLAAALCLTVPLFNYLRLQSASYLTRLGATASMVVMGIAVLGTHSRTGLVGLAAAGGVLLWKSRHRLVAAIIALAVVLPAVYFMPENWSGRMETVEEPMADSSFMGRVNAWKVAANIAIDRPFTGGGFSSTENPNVYQTYSVGFFSPSDAGQRRIRAAHSIYFQVLGDHGFVGLFLFLTILGMTWLGLRSIRRKTRRDAELRWMFDLASAIQVSLFSYLVVGLALSMAYYDLPYIFAGITVALRGILARAQAGKETKDIQTAATWQITTPAASTSK